MPTFGYRCSAGHATDVFFVPGEKRTATTRCGRCRRRARYSKADSLGALELNVCPGTQYSTSLGKHVKSRTHWREELRAAPERLGRDIAEYDRPVKEPDNRHVPNATSSAIVGRPLDQGPRERARAAQEHMRTQR